MATNKRRHKGLRPSDYFHDSRGFRKSNSPMVHWPDLCPYEDGDHVWCEQRCGGIPQEDRACFKRWEDCVNNLSKAKKPRAKMTVTIAYPIQSRKNYHRCGPVSFRVFVDRMRLSTDDAGRVYVQVFLTDEQAEELWTHFCGVGACYCGCGKVDGDGSIILGPGEFRLDPPISVEDPILRTSAPRTDGLEEIGRSIAILGAFLTDYNRQVRTLVEACDRVLDRLEAWRDSAAVAVKQGYYPEKENQIQNYTSLIEGLRPAVEAIRRRDSAVSGAAVVLDPACQKAAAGRTVEGEGSKPDPLGEELMRRQAEEDGTLRHDATCERCGAIVPCDDPDCSLSGPHLGPDCEDCINR